MTWKNIDSPPAPNAGPFIVFHTATARPYIILYSLREIQRGEEVLISYGAADGVVQQQLPVLAKQSHEAHLWIRELEVSASESERGQRLNAGASAKM